MLYSAFVALLCVLGMIPILLLLFLEYMIADIMYQPL